MVAEPKSGERRYPPPPPLPAESGSFPLFGDASPERIERILTTDWDRFSAVVFFITGFAEKWVDAIAEYDVLQQVFSREGRSLDPLDKVFDLLISRAEGRCYVDGSRDQAMAWACERLGILEIFGCDYLTWLRRRYAARIARREAEKAQARSAKDAAFQARADAQGRAVTLKTRPGGSHG